MIYAVMITYNDMPTILRTLKSLEDKVDEIIAIDGRLDGFRRYYGSDFSSDGTLEALEASGATIVGVAGLTEVRKRNCYLVAQSESDWYLHLDADEEWIGDIRISPGVDMMFTPFKRTYPQYLIPRIRLFRNVPGLHYEGKHYWLRDGENRTFALLSQPGNHYLAGEFSEPKILHHDRERDGERRLSKAKYYRTLFKREVLIKEYL